MRTTTVTEAKARLSQLLREVRRGESVLILHRGRPIARLEPVRAGDGSEDDEGRLQRLSRAGVVRRAARAPDASVIKKAPPRVADDHALLGALLADRDEGR